ncbi:MAG: RNA 2',3'-cyclic phosphodiesterase [Candidatus Accumulibacter sp.]|jgi:2'-5' RNA ligase|nr:RNA 2',3'-cyclic phosphodiesterase [Accumulibacter sp.]
MRLFFALWPPRDLSCALAGSAAALARRFGGKPTREETIHMTLAFLDEVDAARLPAVADAGRRVEAAAFDLVVDRFGVWRHNSLLWAGCAEPADGLRLLAAKLRERLLAASIPFAETPRFVPHITLVRKARLLHGEVEMPAPEPLAWPCSSFALTHSRPAANGRREYGIVESFPLSEPSAKRR